ncbi:MULTISPECIES: hypothetical protein [Actinokineospora]|uniref:Uncharacterized protein n=2 Tax=Actinokineospora TaxID=39845 RepID=A0A421AZV0_9PSEU|nr:MULTISPECIES: hypothetical protein [Actinokineospora]RLK55346.1 hypothetical protein CLV68_4831 [Actinokineospora cianjurensis]SER61194.1 hypothetical protein SAMN04487818_104339 [Actinokineospora terrae]
MSLRWRYEDASGNPVTGPDVGFADQDAAEAWFGDAWAGLLAAGVEQVVLLDGADEVYGPMSLRPPA